MMKKEPITLKNTKAEILEALNLIFLKISLSLLIHKVKCSVTYLFCSQFQLSNQTVSYQ